MARSKYIYLILMDDVPFAAFTVKHEAYSWLANSAHKPSQVCLARMHDNPTREKWLGVCDKLAWSREDLMIAYLTKHHYTGKLAWVRELDLISQPLDNLEAFAIEVCNA
jgi:hypothetical protein